MNHLSELPIINKNKYSCQVIIKFYLAKWRVTCHSADNWGLRFSEEVTFSEVCFQWKVAFDEFVPEILPRKITKPKS